MSDHERFSGAPDFRVLVRERLAADVAAGDLGDQRFDELVEEIAQHLEDQYVDALASAPSPQQAVEMVLRRDADWAALVRAASAPPPAAPPRLRERLMESFIQDVRYTCRSLAARPLFSLSVVALLAVGIGANTALFTVVNGVLFAPLPYSEPDRLVAVAEANRRAGAAPEPSNIKAANLIDLQDRARTLADVAGFWQGPAVRTGTDEPEMIAAIRTTHNVFDVLGVEAALGATFARRQQDAAFTAVLDYGYWQRRFAADPAAVGSDMTLDQQVYTIVGVMPEDFRFLDEPFDVFIVGPRPVPEPPFDLGAEYETERSTGYMKGVARLAGTSSVDEARAEIDAIGGALEREFPDEQTDRMFLLTPLRDNLVGSVRGALLLLLGAVGFVLLIACANVANLQLSRANGRRREIAVRSALGASRSRVVRQLLTESIILGITGGLAGVALAFVAMGPLRGFLPDSLPRTTEIGIDATVLGFTVIVSLLTGALFGIAPALQSVSSDVQSAIRNDGRGASVGRSRALLGDALVVVEIALAVVLLTGAGLTLRSLLALQSRDIGFDPERVLTLRLSLPQAKYDSDEKISAMYWRLHDELAALPGVESAATVLGVPFSGTRASLGYMIWGEEEPQEYIGNFQPASPGYFETVGIPLLAGRDFTRADAESQRMVAIVNEEVVRRHFPDVDPLTQALQFETGPDAEPVPIVGVVGAVRYGGYAAEPVPEVYIGFDTFTIPLTSVVVRAQSDPEALIPSVRAKILEIDPDQPVYRVQTLSALMSDTLEQPRFSSRLLSLFAALAMLLAAAGVFGVISYAVAQRTREFGIRMALGAEAGRVLRMVLRRGAVLAAVGIGGGMIAAAIMARLTASMWEGVAANDPLVFTVVPLTLAAVALLASWLPARRATRVDPVIALRAD